MPFVHCLLPTLSAATRVRRHVHGPRADYAALGAGAFASWAGVPGPGEATLVTAGILAAHHRLDLPSAIAIAWFGAALGGTLGWLVGLRAGRALITRPGPLHRMRLSALARGDRFYERFGSVAVFFTPSWIAGIHGMRPLRFLLANAISALVWALLVGVGAYLVGPSILDLLGDLGLVSGVVVGVLAVAAVLGIRRTRRRSADRRRSRAGSDA